MDKGNPYHDWILYNFGRRLKLPIRTMGADENKLRRLKHMKIIDKKEIIYIKDEDKNILKVKRNLKEINRKRRILVISAGDKKTRKVIARLFSKSKVVIFPPLKDYKDKELLVKKVIRRWGLECENADVKETLVRNMIKDIMAWENVLMLWESYQYKNLKITADDIGELFPDNEFFQLERFIFMLIKGKTKYKTTKMAYYFLEVKEYSPKWLLGKIREVFNNLGMFYQAYRGGVLLIPENPRRVGNRAQDLNWDHGLRLGDFSLYKQKKYLKVVDEVPYKHFLNISRDVYKISDRPSKNDIYKLIEEIKLKRVGSKDDKR